MPADLRPVPAEIARRYGPEDVESILGRALVVHARRARAPEGLDEAAAWRVVDEVGGAMGLPVEALRGAFDEESDLLARRRGWLARLRAQPSAVAVAGRIRDRVMAAAGPDGPHVARLTETTREVRFEPNPNQLVNRLHAIRRAPSIAVELLDERGRRWRWFGFELRWPRLVRRASLYVTELDDGFVLDGHLADLRMVDLLGPVIVELERELPGRFTVGQVRVDEL